jgi:hypothetical protein
VVFAAIVDATARSKVEFGATKVVGMMAAVVFAENAF